MFLILFQLDVTMLLTLLFGVSLVSIDVVYGEGGISPWELYPCPDGFKESLYRYAYGIFVMDKIPFPEDPYQRQDMDIKICASECRESKCDLFQFGGPPDPEWCKRRPCPEVEIKPVLKSRTEIQMRVHALSNVCSRARVCNFLM